MAGRRGVGLRGGRRAGLGLPRRREPGAGRRPPPTPLAAFAERAASRRRRCADDRRAVATRSSRCGGTSSRDWAARPRAAPGPAAPADRARRRRSPRTRWYVAPRRADLAGALPGVRRDVHRGGRASPRRSAAAPTSTAPGSRSWSPRAGRSPASRTAGSCSRPRSPRATPYACQVQGVYVDPDRRGEGLAAAGMAAVVTSRCATSRRSCRSTSTSTTRPPAGPTSGPASSRPRPSPPSCSDPACLAACGVPTRRVWRRPASRPGGSGGGRRADPAVPVLSRSCRHSGVDHNVVRQQLVSSAASLGAAAPAGTCRSTTSSPPSRRAPRPLTTPACAQPPDIGVED